MAFLGAEGSGVGRPLTSSSPRCHGGGRKPDSQRGHGVCQVTQLLLPGSRVRAWSVSHPLPAQLWRGGGKARGHTASGLAFHLPSAASAAGAALARVQWKSRHLCLLLCTSVQLPHSGFLCARFTNEETEPQRGELTFPRPCSK